MICRVEIARYQPPYAHMLGVNRKELPEMCPAPRTQLHRKEHDAQSGYVSGGSSNTLSKLYDVAIDSQLGGGIATTEAAQVSVEDIELQLARMMLEEKRKAFDAGALSIIDTIIKLCEMSGGRLNTRQLREYKKYVTSNFERMHDEEERNLQQQEANQEVRTGAWRIDTEMVEFAGTQPTVEPNSTTEEAQPQAGQGGEAVTQAEQA